MKRDPKDKPRTFAQGESGRLPNAGDHDIFEPEADPELVPLIQAMDRRGRAADGLAPERIERSWRRIARRIEAYESTSKVEPGRIGIAATLRGVFALYRRRIAYSVILALAIGGALAYQLRQKPVAALAYAASSVEIEGEGTLEAEPGIQELKLYAGKWIESGRGGGIVLHRSGPEIALAGHTRLRFKQKAVCELAEGSIWLEVPKGRGGFEVVTNELTVRVTGTSFGVTRNEGSIQVVVTEGSVDVATLAQGAAQQTSLAAGQSVALDPATLRLGPVVEGAGESPWVDDLRESAVAASVRPIIPSVTGSR